AFRCATHRLAGSHPIGTVEAVHFGTAPGHAHLFRHGQTGAGDVQQGILFTGVHGETVFTRHGGIDKFQDDVCTDAVDIAVPPLLEGIGGSLAAAFRVRALI